MSKDEEANSPLIKCDDGECPPRYSKTRQTLLTLASTYGMFLAGCGFGYSEPAGRSLLSSNATDLYGNPMNFNDEEVELMTNLLSFGALGSSFFTGFIINSIGRKATFGFLIAPAFLAGNLIIFAACSDNLVLLGRFIVGIGSGWEIAAISVYILETTETEFRSYLIASIMTMNASGIAFIVTLSRWFDWKYLALLSAVSCLPFFLGVFLFCVESPVWLLNRGRKTECDRVVEWLCDTKNESSVAVAVEKVVKPLTESTPDSSDRRRMSVIAAVFNCSLVLNGFAIFLTYNDKILAAMMHIQENEEYFDKLNFYLGAAMSLGGFIVIYLTKAFNRKPLLIWTTLAMAALLLVLTVFAFDVVEPAAEAIPPITLSCYIFVAYLGIAALMFPVTAEILPPPLRANVNAYLTTIYYFLYLISIKTFYTLLDAVQLGGTLLLYTISCVLSGLFILVFVPETKYKI